MDNTTAPALNLYNVRVRYANGRSSVRQMRAAGTDEVISLAEKLGTVLEVAHVVAKVVTTSTLERL